MEDDGISRMTVPDSSTPLMKQYNAIKSQYPDTILLYRVGDFYEMFGDDAIQGAKALKLTLTKKHIGKEQTIPLAGVPHHAVQTYIARLIKEGFKVAICDQMEDPKFSKGVVKRDVTRVITPGTVVESGLLDEKNNSFLAAVHLDIGTKSNHLKIGLAVVDLSTGEFTVTEFSDTRSLRKLASEFERLNPREILIPNDIGFEGQPLQQWIQKQTGVNSSPYNGFYFDYDVSYRALIRQFNTSSLQGFGCEDLKLATGAAGAILNYLKETQKNDLTHIRGLRTYAIDDYLILDPTTLQNLEIFRTHRDGGTEGTLLEVLDQTLTGMGGRKLRAWLSQPLIALSQIRYRQDAIQILVEKYRFRDALRLTLDQVYDLERLLARIGCGIGNARDVLALGKSLQLIPVLKNQLAIQINKSAQATPLTGNDPADETAFLLKQIYQQLNELPELQQLIEHGIIEDPPLSVKEGGIIKDGFNVELDDLRQITRGGKQWIMQLESKERERTGIKSLKIRFNNVFGYYIEITKSNLSSTPEDYERKQTLVNAERFITPELKEWENKILGAEERMMELEYQLFCELRQKIAEYTQQIQETADAIGGLDCLAALAETAVKLDFCRPVITDTTELDIIDGRHPVIEKYLNIGKFVPNDVQLDTDEHRLLLITGPNMAGKSTYIRQVALIVLLAQTGSFVPAKSAKIGWVDRIFTRVGASDNLLRGESTFMVEMNETANILNNATGRSLLILDEIGRGTSTFDGLSIAWAVAEYIHDKIGARTLFATHYHELTQLTQFLPGVKNYNVVVREWNDQVIFLHKIVEGACDRSYGIAVGRLAGLPEPVILRAKEVLVDLEKYSDSAKSEIASTRANVEKIRPAISNVQLTFFDAATHPVIEELKSMDLAELKPIDALLKLQQIQEQLKQEK